jgi:hypothetical protein
MREYRVRFGNFEGSHAIYESVAEFKKENPDIPIRRWELGMDYKAIQVGDWIEAEDGYIVQVLKVALLKSDKYVRTAIRFPMTNIICYDRVNKPPRIPQFYAMFSHSNKGSFAHYPSNFGGRDSAHMIMWAELVLNGMHPFDAYRVVYNDKKYYTGAQMMHKIIKLIHNRHVRKAIMSFINSFSKKLKAEISEDDVVKKIKQHWDAVKAGSTGELAAIKLVKEIYQDGDKIGPRIPALPENGQEQIEEATEAEYEDADPPQIERNLPTN